MFEAFIRGLIWLCVLVLCVWIGVYVLGVLGIAVPPHFIPIIFLIVALVAVLVFYRLFKSQPNPPKWLP